MRAAEPCKRVLGRGYGCQAEVVHGTRLHLRTHMNLRIRVQRTQAAHHRQCAHSPAFKMSSSEPAQIVLFSISMECSSCTSFPASRAPCQPLVIAK